MDDLAGAAGLQGAAPPLHPVAVLVLLGGESKAHLEAVLQVAWRPVARDGFESLGQGPWGRIGHGHKIPS
ncbi:MAG: hypothetical protein WCP04_14350 [Pseudomonadota bacterium]